jgi:hypothetical protein
MLKDSFLNQLDNVEPRNCFFQQDSATARTAVEFWPSPSPDLTVLDLILFLT